MRANQIRRRIIAMSVFICFIFFMQVSSAPPRIEEPSRPAETDRPAEVEDEIPRAMEKEAPEKKLKNRNILKWVLIGAGVVAAGVLVYLLTRKKAEYTLSVALGEGVTGTPAAGSHKYKKGETVDYNYSLSSGYTGLEVKIDGKTAAASDTVTMDKDRQVSATASPTPSQAASISVHSTPSGADIFMDGVNTGEKTPATFTYESGGNHAFLLRCAGYQDYEETVTVEQNQQKTLDAVFTEGIGDEFNAGLAPWWKAEVASDWSVADGLLYGYNRPYDLAPIFYDVPFPQKEYTLTTKIRISEGAYIWHNCLITIAFGIESSLRSSSGYLFCIYPDGWWRNYRMEHYDLTRNSGSIYMLGEACTPAIKGINQWNIIKIIRSHYTWSLYINDVFCHTFFNSRFDPRFVGVGAGSVYDTRFQIDFVHLDMSAGTSAHHAPVVQRTPPSSSGSVFDTVSKQR